MDMGVCARGSYQYGSSGNFNGQENEIHSVGRDLNDVETRFNAALDHLQQLVNASAIPQSENVFSQLDALKCVLENSGKAVISTLSQWKTRQQQLSVGCVAEKDIFNQQLSHRLYLIEQLITLIGSTAHRISLRLNHEFAGLDNLNSNTPQLYQTIDNVRNVLKYLKESLSGLLTNLFKHSLVISKQPPPVVSMFEKRATNKDTPNGNQNKIIRPSKYWFDTEIRVLGAQFWTQIMGLTIAEVECKVLRLDENLVDEQSFEIEPLQAVYQPTKSCASFVDMASQMVIQEEKLNQGLALTYEDFHKTIDLKHVQVEKGRVTEALELKFRRVVEKRSMDEGKKSKEDSRSSQEEEVQQRRFSPEDQEHLLKMLMQPIPRHLSQKNRKCNCIRCNPQPGYNNEQIYLSSLIEHIVAMKFLTKEGQLKLCDCTFLEWFYKTAEMAATLRKYWDTTEIHGFCNQMFAETYLTAFPGRMLIRFADTMMSQLRLSIKDSAETTRIRHITIKYSETDSLDDVDSFNDEKTFAKLITMAARQYGIYHIYPNFKIDLQPLEEDSPLISCSSSDYEKNTYNLSERLTNMKIEKAKST